MADDFTEDFEEELPEDFPEEPSPRMPPRKASAPAPRQNRAPPIAPQRQQTQAPASAPVQTQAIQYVPFSLPARVGIYDNFAQKPLMEDPDKLDVILGVLTEILNRVTNIEKNL
jgi:hypothetical protein